MDNETVADQFLVADQDYRAGQTILALGSIKTSEDDARRIQVSEAEYILPPVLLYHSCEPNAYIDWRDMTLKALKPISKDEVISYHYGTSEYDYSVGAFTCECGSKHCVGHFSGFCNMTESERAGIIAYGSPYIRKMNDLLQ